MKTPKNAKPEAGDRKYAVAYDTRYAGKSRTNIWKNPPKGLQNVWIRRKKTGGTGSKFVIGYTILDDGILSSHSMTITSAAKYLKRIHLVTYVE